MVSKLIKKMRKVSSEAYEICRPCTYHHLLYTARNNSTSPSLCPAVAVRPLFSPSSGRTSQLHRTLLGSCLFRQFLVAVPLVSPHPMAQTASLARNSDIILGARFPSTHLVLFLQADPLLPLKDNINFGTTQQHYGGNECAHRISSETASSRALHTRNTVVAKRRALMAFRNARLSLVLIRAFPEADAEVSSIEFTHNRAAPDPLPPYPARHSAFMLTRQSQEAMGDR